MAFEKNCVPPAEIFHLLFFFLFNKTAAEVANTIRSAITFVRFTFKKAKQVNIDKKTASTIDMYSGGVVWYPTNVDAFRPCWDLINTL